MVLVGGSLCEEVRTACGLCGCPVFSSLSLARRQLLLHHCTCEPKRSVVGTPHIPTYLAGLLPFHTVGVVEFFLQLALGQLGHH